MPVSMSPLQYCETQKVGKLSSNRRSELPTCGKALFNSRLHWIPKAGREAFIVLNHNLEDLNRNDSFHSSLADLSLKLSYTFRF